MHEESKENNTDKKLLIEGEFEFRKTSMGLWPTFRYFFIRTALKTLQAAIGALPDRAAYRIGVGLTTILYRATPKFRGLALRNLKTALGNEKSEEELQRILRKTYVNYGKNLIDFFLLAHRDAAWVESKVLFDDPEFYMRAALEKGKGSIALAAHFGSWELVNARCAIYKYPIAVVVKGQRDALAMKIVMDLRKSWGNEYILREKGVKEECYNQLRQGKILGLVADQNASSKGVFVDFFGKKASTFRGPAEIAMKTGAPIVPAFPSRNPDDTLTLHVYPPVELRDTGDFEADLICNTQLCQNAIEDFCRKHPEEYFWWHKRWKTRPPEELEAAKTR